MSAPSTPAPRAPELLGNTLVWAALLGLTMVGFVVSDARAALVPILVVAGVKCGLVGLQFMGLRAAHPAVRAGFLALFCGLVFALFLAHRHG
ncbi:MAG: cytochrome C oxidase subunit IV family protein [Myxococcales bacterium]|nr:cytochrome C oxidase subunit IV family protein [Myxococcales bacterium]